MDEAKNMALLFFIDHLMQKDGRRTVHDLSCQFGARGFTQEMRDAVGTTQEGLTDFLAQFPSLFAVDGDKVALRGYGDANPLAQMPRHYQRDYVAEAVDFFVAKLHKFGPELQIKSLLGHRSQAAPEVRLISGRHLKEFVEFLQEQTDHFVVEGDRVRLKDMPEPTGEQLVPEVMMDSEGQPLVGVKAKQAVLDYLRGVLEADEDVPIPLEAFYRKFCDRFPHSVRQEVATNPKELLQFLKLNRNVFFIRSNKVSLVKPKPDGGDGAENGEHGSESGRESASDGMGPLSPTRKTAVAQNGNGIHEPAGAESILFPLDTEHISKVELVKSLKQAREVVASLRADLDAMVSRGQERYLVADFKTTTLGASGVLATANRHGSRGGICSVGEEFISIVTVATRERMAVFDVEQSDALLTESGLKQLLEWPGCVKVIHEVRRVATLLAQHYSIQLCNVFDTQIAHSVIQHDKFNKPLAELRNISFVNLRRVYHPQSLMMSDVTPRKLSQAPSWGERPLTDGMLLAASEECHCLATSLYPRIRAQLPPAHRQLFEEKCREALSPHGSGGSTGGTRQTPHSAPPQLLRFPPSLFNVSPTVPEGGVVTSECGLSPNAFAGGLYRPPGARRGFSFGSRRQLITSCQQHSFDQLQPLIPGLMGHFHPRCNSNASAESASPTSGMRKGSAPVMGAPYRPLAHLSANAAPYFPLASIPSRRQMSPKMADAETQTVSTGEITVLKVFYDEEGEK